MHALAAAFQKEVDVEITEARRFLFAARAKELQQESLARLEKLRKKAGDIKAEIINVKDEDSANAMLCFELVIDAIIEELKMWIALKDDNPNAAWDYLVDAQQDARFSVQAHSLATNMTRYVRRLELVEQLLFPPQIFVSSAMVVDKSECSICGKPYGKCSHVIGRPYMGELCSQTITSIRKFEHVAIVENPSSKHTRMMEMTADNVTRDLMTWRTKQPKNAKS